MAGLGKRWILVVAGMAVAGLGYTAAGYYGGDGLPDGIASGNGRIEAVEIDISTKIPGRIKEILADEGEFVTAGQILARMDTAQLEAQRRQADASLQRALIGVDTARSLVQQSEAQHEAATAVVGQREAELDAAERRFARTEQLVAANTASQQTYDNDRAAAQGAKATLAAAKASVAAARAGISAAKAQVVDAEASVASARAAIETVTADIDDSTLLAPRDGRVQYRVAQPGEVLSAGGRVLNLVDLGDVYMTLFLPTGQAGRVAIGADVLLVLDAAPQYVIPAKVSFVSDVAQFTPKTVEAEEERQKLMFRIKAKISPDLLRKYVSQVKTGLPGMAYVQIAADAVWPPHLIEAIVR
ncbi:HlyD family efflux transporter periplasmic adaptor subunit [Agrobacterium sp. FDAARGOS_525]|uniref:HlyD family secretion protein n=1 Tax=Agrobacterium sp. FDAARGOS_525 TaxID=2420311 RepID=UPI000F68882F|nr:HlyD family efflux transporter periplasmic adaptor subunit [Agrobacterium sp. FDAARGOS_525]RSC21416.1 HlyD family efflux transporter periplasmic adaptor subunit [Agrobacterium sp. FDAARGOS_525]